MEGSRKLETCKHVFYTDIFKTDNQQGHYWDSTENNYYYVAAGAGRVRER